ncbi:MAG: hypothetical protein ABI972_31270 [Acidobacteriota bacterium]
MARDGTLSGMIRGMMTTVAANVSIYEVENRLKEIDKANQELSARWDKMLSSPQVAAYRTNKDVGDWEQTQMIIDLENLLSKMAAVCIAQQNVLTAVVGALKNINRKQ